MKAILVSLSLALLAACSTNSEPTGSAGNGANGATADATPKAVPAALREVRCGCRIDGIHKCGNYVDVDGTWLEITNPADHDLGVMEWCSNKEKVEAEVAGEIEDEGIKVSALAVQ